MNQNIVKNALLNTIINPIVEQSKIIWNFTRPHTIVGSCISIICLYLYETLIMTELKIIIKLRQ